MDNYKIAIRRQKRNRTIFKKLLKNKKGIFSRFSPVALLILFGFGILNIASTNSYYNDIEKSESNVLVAGALDFVISDGGFNPVPPTLNFEPGTTTSKIIDLYLEPESNPIKYTASTTAVTGDIPFCDAIVLNASLNNQNQFSGSLTSFLSTATTTMATTSISTWKYDFTMLPSSHFYNSVCSFAFEYNGRQTLPHNEYSDGGYYDMEEATSTIVSWGFRINKVYYDVKTTSVASTTRGVEGVNEWVEIYNQTDTALDINGWKICDNNECDTISSTSPIMIPAKGFGVITASSTTWKYWELADNVVPILLSDTRIGNGLGDNGDRLILQRPDGLVVDKMSWGTDTSVWNPAIPDVPEGHTLARKPTGYDTDQASDFADLAPPNLSLIYPEQSGTMTWYWTQNYNILWSATNPNGPNSDLLIDLSYIKDLDHSNTITEADENISIAESLSNTGSYSWTVPSGFLGYIWINIVAFGPENPMLNTKVTSGKIYDPYPVEILLTDPSLVAEAIKENSENNTPLSLEEEVPNEIAQEVPQIDEEIPARLRSTENSEIMPKSGVEEELPADDLVTSRVRDERILLDEDSGSDTNNPVREVRTESLPNATVPEQEPVVEESVGEENVVELPVVSESLATPEKPPEPVILPEPAPEVILPDLQTN